MTGEANALAGARRRWMDGAAVATSALCLVHCLLLPAIVIVLPALAAWLALPEAFHRWAFIFAVPTSAAALLLGYRRHRRLAPATLAAPGLSLLGIGAFLAAEGAGEVIASVAGALLLAAAHLANRRAAGRAETCVTL